MSDVETFALAPMSSSTRLLTAAVLALPMAMLVGARLGGPTANTVGVAVASTMIVIFLYVYLRMRPKRFEVDGAELRIVFPTRTLKIDVDDIVRAGPVSYEVFRKRYPRPIRFGAGGLFGGFGLLFTQNGRVQFYISTNDPLVLMEFESGRMPLLISPSDPDAFVKALG